MKHVICKKPVIYNGTWYQPNDEIEVEDKDFEALKACCVESVDEPEESAAEKQPKRRRNK